jgi:nanoRNase/pAp phosphatase (c-di-AMP/oligoRNAs hydrolase)
MQIFVAVTLSKPPMIYNLVNCLIIALISDTKSLWHQQWPNIKYASFRIPASLASKLQKYRSMKQAEFLRIT